jgi:hypothetical protein
MSQNKSNKKQPISITIDMKMYSNSLLNNVVENSLSHIGDNNLNNENEIYLDLQM